VLQWALKFVPSVVALVQKNLSCVECTIYSCKSQYIANFCTSTIDVQKHNLTMVSDASPGTTASKMNKSLVLMSHVSSGRACARDGYLKRPHLTIIDGDMR
jgi:hypothetical protein